MVRVIIWWMVLSLLNGEELRYRFEGEIKILFWIYFRNIKFFFYICFKFVLNLLINVCIFLEMNIFVKFIIKFIVNFNFIRRFIISLGIFIVFEFRGFFFFVIYK